MKKILLFLLMGIGMCFVSFVSATCQTNNNFETGEDFNVCTGKCKFYNSTDASYQDCNNLINCYLTMSYPNGTFLGFFKSMQFNAFGDEIFNYSFGNITDSVSFPSGIYQGQINCYSSYGFSDPINFEAIVSSVGEPAIPGTGGYPLVKITLNSLDIDYDEEWCFDLEYRIIIKPLNLNGDLTEIPMMNYRTDVDFLQTGGLSEQDLVYYITFYPNSTKANSTAGVENVTISIEVNQFGKVVSEDINILVKECTSLKKSIQTVFTGIGNFWNKHWILVSIILFVIIVFVIIAVLYMKGGKH